MNHSDAVNAVLLTMTELGALPLKYTTGSFKTREGNRIVEVGRKGAADTIHCWRGKFVAIEIKVDRDRQRPEQAAFQRAVEAAGGIYIVAWFTDGVDGCETIRCSLS